MQLRQAEACDFIKKETLLQVSVSEFCKNFKNTLFYKKTLHDVALVSLLLTLNRFDFVQVLLLLTFNKYILTNTDC